MYTSKLKFTRIIPETVTHFGVPFLPPSPTLSLLLHFDGPNGSQVFTDSSQVRHTVSISADLSSVIDTSQSVFGGSSLRTTTGYLNIADNDGTLAFGATSDFTIDFWVRFIATNVLQHIVSVSENSPFFVILLNAAGTVNVVSDVDGIIVAGTIPLSPTTWYHVAVTRQFGTWRLFINGTQDSFSTVHFPDLVYGGEEFRICNGGFGLNGWVDELRVLKGQAAWTADFTPPTSPYPPP